MQSGSVKLHICCRLSEGDIKHFIDIINVCRLMKFLSF